MSKIALAMIVRGGEKDIANLGRAINSVIEHVDRLFITVTGTKKEYEDIKKRYLDPRIEFSNGSFDWKADKKTVDWLRDFFGHEPFMKVGDEIFEFDKARNFNFGQVPADYEWIMWMDSDDVVRNAQNLRGLAEVGLERGIEAFYFNYLYQVDLDKEGNIKHIIIEHLRERLVRNIGVYKWVAPIHETLIEQRPTQKTDNDQVDLVHLATMDDRMKSLERNLKNLELAIYRSDGKDPRHLYYLAKALYDIRTPETDEKAIKLIYAYLLGPNPSGWPEERSQAYEYLAEIYRRKGEHNNSIKSLMNSLIEQPENASIYFNIAGSYMIKGDFERALFWIRLGAAVPEKKTTLVKNPRDLQVRTLEIVFNCCLNLSKVDEAWAAMTKLHDMEPENKQYQDMLRFVTELRTQRDLTMKYVELASFLEKTGEAPKVRALLNAVPQLISGNPFIVDLEHKVNPPKEWQDKEIAIYCGQGFTNWSPKQLDNPGASFVGGSEEAVINIARELQKEGWKVTVYADPGADEGEYEGVKWLPYYKFNKSDQFNILIAWRDIRFFDYDFTAKKKYLWCHDIQNQMEYTPERVERIDKIFFLSKWHRDNVPTLEEVKVFLTSNGI